MKKCSTNKNGNPPCKPGFYQKTNSKGEECCYKGSKKTTKTSAKKPASPKSPASPQPNIALSADKPKVIAKGPAAFFDRAPVHTVSPEAWALPNQVEFTEWLTDTFVGYRKRPLSQPDEEAATRPTDTMQLFPHQLFVQDYMQYKSPYRGLLVYHGLGVGKSCTSIAAAEMLIRHKHVVIMLPAALQPNYITEIKKCGNRYYDRTKHHWVFVKDGVTDYVDPAVLKKNKGFWEVNDTKPPNYSELSAGKRDAIDRQIESIINKNYTFINYNGIDEAKIKDTMQGKGFFDNKVIIVDEAHNFISGVSNESKIVKSLYALMLTSKNSKIILLTGTPIINKPFEIAFVVNLLKGYQYQHVLEVRENNEGVLSRVMGTIPQVDTFKIEILPTTAKIHVTLLPTFFRRTSNGKVLMDDRQMLSDEDVIAKIVAAIEAKSKKSGKTLVRREEELFKYLPTKEEAFNSYFVDENKKTIKNSVMFMRRILGSVSHFTNDDPLLYPTMNVMPEDVYMSDYQFDKYFNARVDEVKLEKKKKNPDSLWSTPSVYKTYSRTICNFVFPEGITRPKPKDVDKELKKSDKKTVYDSKVEAALNALYLNEEDYLLTNLATYSPKFLKIAQNVRSSPGNVLIYSQFSIVEGVELISRVLQTVLKYKELVVKHTTAGWDIELPPKGTLTYIKFKPSESMNPKRRTEYINIVLSIYNNDFKQLPDTIRAKLKGRDNLRGDVLRVLFVTQSGAEGISLKNVRQVHITEPYWNKNRIDQVIGRANRTNSHVSLPADERNFDVFMYRMRFTKDQLADKTKTDIIRRRDKELTTDEVIYGIADRKHQIIEHFLEAMQKAAVDCPLNNASVGCFSFPVDLAGHTKAHTMDIAKDTLDSHSMQNITTMKRKAFKITIGSMNRSYIYVEDTNELFDYSLYVSTRVLKPVGYMKSLDATRFLITYV